MSKAYVGSASCGAASPGRARIRGHGQVEPYVQARRFPSAGHSWAPRGRKAKPSGAMAAWHGRRGRRKEGVRGLDKIDGLVAIKKKISRWRLSY